MDPDSSSSCANCGSTFKYSVKGKGYHRRSFLSKLNTIDATIKDVIQTEFDVQLTPEQKSRRFLCEPCCRLLTTAVKSKQQSEEAKRKLDAGACETYLKRKVQASYVSSKINSPFSTPVKSKRRRLKSPQKLPCSTTSAAQQLKGKALPKRRFISKVARQRIDIDKAVRYLTGRKYRQGIHILLKSSVGFKKALISTIANATRQETVSYATSDCVFKGSKTIEEMAEFDWEKVFNQLIAKCPILTNVLVGSLTSKKSSKTFGISSKPAVSVKPVIGTIAAIVMYMRRPSLCSFQEMNSLQLWLSSTKRQMFPRLNHLGLCTGIVATRSSIDRIRRSYDSQVYQWKTTAVDYLSGMIGDTSEETIPYADADSNETDIETDSMMEYTPPSSPPAKPATQPAEHTSVMTQSSEESNSGSVTSEHTGKVGYSICFDNVNTKVTVRHQVKDKKNKMFNMVQAYAAQDRIPSLHMSDTPPTADQLSEMPLDIYFPSPIDEATLRSEMTVLVTRTLVSTLPVFQQLHPFVNQHIKHKFSTESSVKSKMVPLGVLDKDESKIADMIDIMGEYQKYVPLKPTGEPLTIPLHADGLSCERGNDAQSARINGNDAWNQLQGLALNIQEWHKRCLLLQDVYDELYGHGGRDKGTLHFLKNYFNHRSVTTNVKESFNYNEEFLDFCGDAYVVLAAMHIMGITEIDGVPDNFPTDTDEELHILNSVATQIIDMIFISCQHVVQRILQDEQEVFVEPEGYCVCQLEQPGPMVFCENRNCRRGVWFHLECLDMTEDDVPEDKWYCSAVCREENAKRRSKNVRRKTVADTLNDGKRHYVLLLMWRSLNQKVRRDAIRENDGDRMLMHWKFDMLQYFEKHHPKYFLLGQRLLSATNGAVCPRLQHVLTWNRTVNPNGGPGKNIAMDLQMEYFNKEYKESVKDAAGHLTDATIARHSQMIGVGKAIQTIYTTQVSGLPSKGVHKSEHFSREKDINEFVLLLKGEDLFTQHPGRSFVSFPDMNRNLFTAIDTNGIRKRLQRHTQLMAKRRQVIQQMQRR